MCHYSTGVLVVVGPGIVDFMAASSELGAALCFGYRRNCWGFRSAHPSGQHQCHPLRRPVSSSVVCH